MTKKKKMLVVIGIVVLAIVCMLYGRSCGKKAAQKELDKAQEDVTTYQERYTDAVNERLAVEGELKAVQEELDQLKAAGVEAASEETEDAQEGEDAEVAEEEAPAEEVQEQAETAEEPAEDKKTIDGVDADLKAFLDSYEAFMDEYVEFMKKYSSDSSNAISMLGDYTKMLSKYEKFAADADKYDANSMSAADAKYYLDAMNRINQKLLSVY